SLHCQKPHFNLSPIYRYVVENLNLVCMKSTLIYLLIFYFAIGAQCNSPQNFDSPKKEYSAVLEEILAKRDAFRERYDNTDSTGKKSIIVEAENYIFNAITTDVFPQWYGTKWDFNGTTRIPREG